MSASGGTIGQTGTPVTATALVANGIASAILPAVAGKTTYCTGFEVTAAGATAAAAVIATLSGVAGVTLDYIFATPAGAQAGAFPLDVSFVPPLPASATNQAITLTLPALGAGNLFAAVAIHGYQL